MIELIKKNIFSIQNFQVDSHGHGWVELSKAIFSSDAKTLFLRLAGVPEGSFGRFKHIAAIDVKVYFLF